MPKASVGQLLRACDETKLLTPKRYLEHLLDKMEWEHERQDPGEAFKPPGSPRLAKLLKEAGYRTPKGHAHWWPAQVQPLLSGRFEPYYAATAGAS